MILSATGVSHTFEHTLFDGLDISLDGGEAMSIMGVSGSGKSTLLNILSTFLLPQRGSVELFGKDIYAIPQKEQLEIRRNELGVIFQSHYLFRGFSGYENIEVASLLSGRQIEDSLLELFGIKDVIYQNVGTLSGGQQQRVSIARVLTKKPKIIFADEPTGNLDKESAGSVMDAIFEYVALSRAVLILATHDRELALRCKYAKRLINKGLEDISS